MHRNHLLESKDVAHGLFKAIEALAAGVRLVTAHQGGPLLRAHGRSAAVGEQVDDHVLGLKQEEVVRSFFETAFTLLARGHLDGFDYFDFEGFNDCLHDSFSRFSRVIR